MTLLLLVMTLEERARVALLFNADSWNSATAKQDKPENKDANCCTSLLLLVLRSLDALNQHSLFLFSFFFFF
jgi:hypothetical protein